MLKDYDLVGHDFEPTSLNDHKMSKWVGFLVEKSMSQRMRDNMVIFEDLHDTDGNGTRYFQKVSMEIAKEIQETTRNYLEGRFYGIIKVDEAMFLSDENGVFETHHVESLFKTDIKDIAKEVGIYINRFLKTANENTEATNTMTVSKMIKKLRELEREHGDLPMKAFMYGGLHLEHISENDVRVRFRELVDGNKVGKEVVIEGVA